MVSCKNGHALQSCGAPWGLFFLLQASALFSVFPNVYVGKHCTTDNNIYSLFSDKWARCIYSVSDTVSLWSGGSIVLHLFVLKCCCRSQQLDSDSLMNPWDVTFTVLLWCSCLLREQPLTSVSHQGSWKMSWQIGLCHRCCNTL